MKTKNKISKYRHKNNQSTITEVTSIEQDQISCPYCYSFTHFVYGQECKCEVCRQLINEGDLLYEN